MQVKESTRQDKVYDWVLKKVRKEQSFGKAGEIGEEEEARGRRKRMAHLLVALDSHR